MRREKTSDDSLLKDILTKFANPEFYPSDDAMIEDLKSAVDSVENKEQLVAQMKAMMESNEISSSTNVSTYFDYEIDDEDAATEFIQNAFEKAFLTV